MRVKYNMEEERKLGLKKGLDYIPRGLYVTSLVGGGSPVGLLNVGAWRATVKGTTRIWTTKISYRGSADDHACFLQHYRAC